MPRRAVFHDAGAYDDGGGSLSVGTPLASDPLWDTKGDLAVATGANAASKLAVGSNGQVLTADSTQTTGTKWATPSTSGGVDHLSKSGDTALTGDVTLSEGTNITLTQVGQDIEIAASGGGSAELDYVQRTSDFSVSTEADWLTGASVSYDGSTRIKIECFAAASDTTGGNGIIARVYDGTTAQNRIVDIRGASGNIPIYGVWFVTPSAGSHTYKITAVATSGTLVIYAGSGTGGASAYAPSFMRITEA